MATRYMVQRDTTAWRLQVRVSFALSVLCAAIGVINQKTTAVRLIPVVGKGVGESVEFGGLLGWAPIMKVGEFSSAAFIHRGGRIPAPVRSLTN